MSVGDSRELLALLQDIERRSLTQAAAASPPCEQPPHWQGVLFKVLGRRLVVPLSDVSEILRFPAAITRVPGTQPWFLGVANMRGRLLSLADLNLFLGGSAIVPGRRSRILAIRQGDLQAGLLVEEVEGMRRLQPDLGQEPTRSGDPLQTYAPSTVVQEGEALPLFSMQALADSPLFREAAL